MDIICELVRDRPLARQVPALQGWVWLQKGFQDFHKAPLDCLLYGSGFVLLGYFLLECYWALMPEYELAVVLTCVLLGPCLLLAVQDIAKQTEVFYGRGRVTLQHSVEAVKAQLPALSLYIALLCVLLLFWLECSLLLVAFCYETADVASLNDLLGQAWQGNNLLFLGLYSVLSGLWLGLLFTISIVAIPLLLDKQLDAVRAMVMSWRVVSKNKLTMLLWAAIIAAMSAIGFATNYIGLIIIMPVLALASWHAYRDLIIFERLSE